MPIEFACESCARLLRVPDGSEGSQCECPACSTILEVPDPSAVGMIEVHQQSDDLKLDLQIPCPRCQQILRCAPKLLGTKGQCRHCKYIFTISDEPVDSDQDTGTGANWVFSCPKCDQLFEGKEEMRGRKGKCHVCGEVFAIELRNDSEAQFSEPFINEPLEPSPASTQTNASSAGDTPKPAAEEAAMVQFGCPNCDGVMEVPATAAGQTTQCPYCSTHLIVPTAEEASRSQSTASNQQDSAYAPGGSQASSKQQDEFRLAPLDVEGGSLGAQVQTGSDPYADLVTPGSSANAPYAPPPESPSVPAGNWQAPSTRKKKKLTFSNVFSLAFESAFPNCLISSLAYIITTMLAVGLFYGCMIAVGVVMGLMEMDPVVIITIVGIVGVITGIIAMGIVAAGYCIMINGALLSVRGQAKDTGELFSTGGALGPILIYFVSLAVPMILVGGFQQLLIYALGPDNAIIILCVTVLFSLLFALLGLALSLTPFAILDGQGVIEAMRTSASIFSRNGPLMVGVGICGALLVTAVSMVTCGIGSILLSAFPFYLLAAFYQLAPKPRA